MTKLIGLGLGPTFFHIIKTQITKQKTIDDMFLQYNTRQQTKYKSLINKKTRSLIIKSTLIG